MSINNLAQFVTILAETEASLSLPRIANLTKKLAVDNIKQQKEIIREYNIPTLTQSFALMDIGKYSNKFKV